MACASCQADLAPDAKFCGACGQKVGEQPTLLACACGAALDAGAQFCGECGTRVETPIAASPAALAAYAESVAEFAADGVLVPAELDVLAAERRELGISDAQHEAAVQRHRCFLGLPASLELDLDSTYLVAGQPSTLRVRLRNAAASARDVIKGIDIVTRSSTSGRLRVARSSSILGKGQVRELSVPIDPPPSAGQYSLDGFAVAAFRDGRVFRGRFQLPALRASEAGRQEAPREFHLNVDAHNAAMVKDIGNVGVRVEQDRGGVFASGGNWTPIELHPARADEVEAWRKSRVGGPPAVPGAVVGDPHRCRGLQLHLRRGETEDRRELWLVHDTQLSFGRDGRRSDVLAAVEPYLPAERHRGNVALSMKISSVHLSVRLGVAGGFAQDLGSSNGTVFDGSPLQAHTPVPIERSHRIVLGEALALEAEELSQDGEPFGVWVRRLENVPTRSYLLFQGKVGLWPERARVVGRPRRGGELAPLTLTWLRGGPCVQNHGDRSARIDGESLPVGQGQMLGPGQRLEIGGSWLFYVHGSLA